MYANRAVSRALGSGRPPVSRVRAFLLGLWEFRSCWTTHVDDEDALNAYEWGREVAHRVTFRKWEE